MTLPAAAMRVTRRRNDALAGRFNRVAGSRPALGRSAVPRACARAHGAPNGSARTWGRLEPTKVSGTAHLCGSATDVAGYRRCAFTRVNG